MSKSIRVPEAMKDKFLSIQQLTDAFCTQHLNQEYKEVIDAAIAALCRKRPSPLLKGHEHTWAASIVHAVGMVNFLFDKAQTPHCQASDIHAHFGVGSSTCGNKSREIRTLLKMTQDSPDWMIPSMMEQNPLIWMLEINDYIVDVRQMPLHIQEMAYERGLIPYVPALKKTS